MYTIKTHFKIILHNSKWLVSNGSKIRFWTYKSSNLGNLGDFLQIPSHFCHPLTSLVQDFIINSNWNIPSDSLSLFPKITTNISSIVLPLRQKEYNLHWKNSISCRLYLKHAYSFVNMVPIIKEWSKIILNPVIPRLNSTLIWIILNHKMPTDDTLARKGCQFPSTCSLCKRPFETKHHIFLDCTFSLNV